MSLLIASLWLEPLAVWVLDNGGKIWLSYWVKVLPRTGATLLRASM